MDYPPPTQPPSQPYGTPVPAPAQPPKKNNRTLWIILGAVGVILVCCVIGSIALAANGNKGGTASSTATTGPTATPKAPTATPKPKVWTTIKTFSGNGDQQTGDFTVPNDNWRMVWSCDPTSFDGIQYNVAVDVDPVDTTQIGDPAAINTICSSSNASGTTNIHDLSGTLYLNVTSEAVWKIEIQVFE